MEKIMSHAVPTRYSRACRALLGVAAAALVAAPFAAGFLAAQSLTVRPGVEFVGAKVAPGHGRTSGHTELLAALTSIMNPVVAESEVLPTDRYQKWLSEVAAYLITPEERAAFLALKSDAERDHFIEQFWNRRDPSPGTPENEFKEEHYRRIAWANEMLGKPGIPGWKTDRGRLYIVMGPPNEREEHPGSFEIWTYNNVDDSTDKLIVTFNIR
jgi:GWxTD domain-containing protein